MNVLLLIPSVRKTGIEDEVAADRHPRMDYDALAEKLRAGGDTVDFLDYASVRAAPHALVRLLRALDRSGGGISAQNDAALGALAFHRRGEYDALFVNSESVALPLALLLRTRGRRGGGKRVRPEPTVVVIGHRLSTGKKRLFFGAPFRLHEAMNSIFVYATSQREFGVQALGIEPERLARIAFHADTAFYRPGLPGVHVDENQICAAGLEWRDYPTLIEAVRPLTDLRVKLAAASPWSKRVNETEGRSLPPHVEARRYAYDELRLLYASSAFVVAPLYENDFQAGVTTLLEAMAMGKAVIVTRTEGQGSDVVTDGENGLTVAPGDVNGWRAAIARLREDTALRDQLGRNARRWVEENASLELWTDRIVTALRAGRLRSPPPISTVA